MTRPALEGARNTLKRNSLSGKEDARSGSDSGSKIGYIGEVLAGAPHKGGAVKAGEYRGKPALSKN